jgi:dephospho-CoA kinase
VPKRLKKELIKLTAKDRLHQLAVPVIGLTGGIATGKSTASKILQSFNLSIICADQLVKKVYQTEQTRNYLEENLPSVINGQKIDFAKLRLIAFNHPQTLQKLEDAIYPQMGRQFRLEYQAINTPPLIIYDVPLLFEKGLTPLFDLTICIYTTYQQQLERLMERDSISKQQAEQMLARQDRIEKKCQLADYAIDNGRDPAELRPQLEELFSQITEDC